MLQVVCPNVLVSAFYYTSPEEKFEFRLDIKPYHQAYHYSLSLIKTNLFLVPA